MALNWDVSEVENHNELFKENGDMKSPYSSILLSTMSVGINRITQKNWEQFYKRINLLEKVFGCYHYINAEPNYITEEDVKRLIGLHTNAAPKTKNQFLKQFLIRLTQFTIVYLTHNKKNTYETISSRKRNRNPNRTIE